MRYEQKQIDKFLAEAKTSSLDILDLSKKHGIHPHTGNLWARKYLPKKILDAIRARGRHIRALHAAASRTAEGGNGAVTMPAATAHSAHKAVAHGHEAVKTTHKATHKASPVANRSVPKQRSSRQALAALKARLLTMLDDVSRLQAAGT